MTEDEMQACLDAGELPGTPSEARAIEKAYELGFKAAIEVAAARAATHAGINDFGFPRRISLDIVELLRTLPRHAASGGSSSGS